MCTVDRAEPEDDVLCGIGDGWIRGEGDALVDDLLVDLHGVLVPEGRVAGEEFVD